jgi:protoporphyrinogen IX oxidase
MIYLWLKALHIISFTAWMAGMFYLPRLYVYHTTTAQGSGADLMLQTMERKLLRFIMNPAMILTFIFGVSMIVYDTAIMKQGWLHAKILLVLGMAGFHGYLAKTRKDFITHDGIKSHKFYRVINEIPTLLLIGIVILAVVKPF